MLDFWVLTVKTSLPETAIRFDKLKTSVSVFDSFEKGREALRTFLRKTAFAKNAMFDGNGRIRMLEKYIEENAEEEEVWDEEERERDRFEINKESLSRLSNLLKEVFEGNDVIFPFKETEATDWMIGASIRDGSIFFRGDDDGPCNGYDPVLNTNMFSMEEKQDYHLYIEDLFGQRENPSVLYIDLVSCSLNAK